MSNLIECTICKGTGLNEDDVDWVTNKLGSFEMSAPCETCKGLGCLTEEIEDGI